MRKNRGVISQVKNKTEDRKAIFDSIESEWRTARLLAMRVLHTHAPAIEALTPVFKSGVPGLTQATDRYLRVYVSLEHMQSLIDQARAVSPSNPCKTCGATHHHHLAYVAGSICHEAMHPLNQHFRRADEIFVSRPDVWNLAGDCEINDDLIEVLKNPDTSNGNTVPQLCRDPGRIYPSTFKLPDNKIAEYYYFEIMQDPPPEQDSCNCGSGAHGIPQPWDAAAPGTDGNGGDIPGVNESEIPFIQKQVAENIQKEASQGRGNVPAGMIEWANKVLAKPKYDWRKDLQKTVRISLNQAYGFDLPTYRRFARDCAASNYAVIQPSHYKPKPRVAVGLDTSGSMGGFYEGSPLYEAVCEVEGIAKGTGAEIEVLDVDCAANASQIQSVCTAKGMKLRGHGGTDMRVPVEVFRARKANRPDVLVILTDGETPWPAYKPKEFKVIIGLVGNPSKSTIDACPSWAKVIVISQDDKKTRRKK